MRTPKTFTQSLQPLTPVKLYKLELVADVSLGPEFAGARPRTYTDPGDEVVCTREKAKQFISNRWCLLKKGEDFPFDETPTFNPAQIKPSGWISNEPKPDLRPRRVKLVRPVFVSKHHKDAAPPDVITVNAQLARLLVGDKAAELMPGEEPLFEMGPSFVLQ